MANRLDDKVCIVTGAGRGIGRAIALELARAGADTLIAYRSNAAAAEAVAAEIGALGRKSLAVQSDVARADEVERLVDAAQRGLGRVDILVNNAGVTRDGLIMRMSDVSWDEVIATNLRGAFLCTRAVLRPMLRARWGRIINVTSVVAVAGNPGQANYAAAKAGLIGMSKALAREVASRGVTVNCVAPGLVTSPMTDALSDKQRDSLLSVVPVGRLGTVEEIAAAVVYVASDEAGYVTGATLHVNGGMAMV